MALRMGLMALVAAMATACSPQTRVVGGGAGPVLGAPVKMSAAAVKADLTVVGDATQILREAAQDSFAEAKMTCPGPSAGCATVDLHATIRPASPSFAAATPPIRVIELVANYRGPDAQQAASAVSYTRTVAVPGNLSTATWLRISDALTTDLAGDFSFRSQKHGIVVRLPSWATGPSTVKRASEARPFNVAITSDGRSNNDTIGVVGNREVRLARRATDYIAEMLTDDLRGAGQIIVPAKDGRQVGSQLDKFWISSAQRSGGWQTTAEIQVDFEVGPPPGVKRKKPERHSCLVTEQGAYAPTEPELARLLQKCLTELMRSIRSDSAWSLGQS